MIDTLLCQIRVHILGRPTNNVQFIFFCTLCGEPQIDELHLISIHQDVIKFQVSVHNIVAVHEVDSIYHFREDYRSLAFGESRFWFAFLDDVEKVRALAKLHYQVHLGSGVYYFVKAHDVRMLNGC